MSIVARPCLASAATVVVAKYRRVSTAGQLDGFGLDDQDDICNGWLGGHPEAAVFDDYVDEAVPGSLASRPERQLSWWQKGAWPHVMEVLDPGTKGVPAYRRSMLPQVKVNVRNGVRLFTQGRRERYGATDS
jgi:hypothetical protein